MAHGCSFCNPNFDDSFLRAIEVVNFVIPRTFNTDSTTQIYANKHDLSRCPTCAEVMHAVEPDGKWRCADPECDTVWKGRRV